MNHNMDAVANTNTNSDHDPDFKTFWKQLHRKWWIPKTVFNVQSFPRQQIDCCSVTPKRMEHWNMAIEAGFAFAALESMVVRHKNVALSPRVLLSESFLQNCGWMGIGSLYLNFGSNDQFGEEDKQVIRFVIRLAAEHSLKSPFDEGIRLTQSFVEMKQLHDIPLVTHRVHLCSCDLVDCDKLMFNISQNSKWALFHMCKLANGGVDLCRWMSPDNCSITKVFFVCNPISCDSLAKLFQSNKRINKLTIAFCSAHGAEQVYSQQEMDQLIKLLSDTSHLKQLGVSGIWNGLSRQEQDTRFDHLVSLLGNKSLSSLACDGCWHPTIFQVPPETLSGQMEALQQALERTTQLTYLHIRPCPPAEHAHSYNTFVECSLRRNHRNKVRAVMCSLPTWPRPLALFGEMLMRTSKHRGLLDALGREGTMDAVGLMGEMDPMSETFHLLLQGSETLKQAWDDKRADRLVRVDDPSARFVDKEGTSMIDAILRCLGALCSSNSKNSA